MEIRLKEFPDYIFNEDGTVYSELSSKILKNSTNKRGYQTYRLKNKEGKFITKSAHRLFAEALLDDFDEDLQVDHIDGDKHNNAIRNLEMVTASENTRRGIKNGLISTSNLGHRTAYGYDVQLEPVDGGDTLHFETLGDAFKYLGYNNNGGYTSWYRVRDCDRILRRHKITVLSEPRRVRAK